MNTEPTAEEALAELREMFSLKVRGNKLGRRIDVEFRQSASSSPRGDRLHTQALSLHFLSECNGVLEVAAIIRRDDTPPEGEGS